MGLRTPVCSQGKKSLNPRPFPLDRVRISAYNQGMTKATTTPIRYEILDKPSNSKGWARYSAPGVQSRTGNEWVSAPHNGDICDNGTPFELRTQVQLRKARGGQHPLSTDTYRLVAMANECCEIEHRPGSQGLRLRIWGARLAR